MSGERIGSGFERVAPPHGVRWRLMDPQPSPDERFEEVQSILNQLTNSQRHLLTAQVLMNDRLSRAEKLIEQLAEQGVQTNQRLDRLTDKVASLADGQKHTDAKLDALSDIVRQWIERNGKSGNGQHPS